MSQRVFLVSVFANSCYQIQLSSLIAEIMELRKAFQSYDTEKDGVVSLDEFKAVFSKYNYTDEEMNTMFNNVVCGLLLTW